MQDKLARVLKLRQQEEFARANTRDQALDPIDHIESEGLQRTLYEFEECTKHAAELERTVDEQDKRIKQLEEFLVKKLEESPIMLMEAHRLINGDQPQQDEQAVAASEKPAVVDKPNRVESAGQDMPTSGVAKANTTVVDPSDRVESVERDIPTNGVVKEGIAVGDKPNHVESAERDSPTKDIEQVRQENARARLCEKFQQADVENLIPQAIDQAVDGYAVHAKTKKALADAFQKMLEEGDHDSFVKKARLSSVGA
jgi:hypothetical protein